MSHRYLERTAVDGGILDPEWTNRSFDPFKEEASNKLNQNNFLQRVRTRVGGVYDNSNEYTNFENTIYSFHSTFVTTPQEYTGVNRWLEADGNGRQLLLNLTSRGSMFYIVFSLQIADTSVLSKPGAMFSIAVDGQIYTPSIVGTVELSQDLFSAKEPSALPANEKEIIYGNNKPTTGRIRYPMVLEATVYLGVGNHVVRPKVFLPKLVGNISTLATEITLYGSAFGLEIRK